MKKKKTKVEKKELSVIMGEMLCAQNKDILSGDNAVVVNQQGWEIFSMHKAFVTWNIGFENPNKYQFEINGERDCVKIYAELVDGLILKFAPYNRTNIEDVLKIKMPIKIQKNKKLWADWFLGEFNKNITELERRCAKMLKRIKHDVEENNKRLNENAKFVIIKKENNITKEMSKSELVEAIRNVENKLIKLKDELKSLNEKEYISERNRREQSLWLAEFTARQRHYHSR